MQYISELEQLLLTAKHPRVRLLLQKALNDATIAQRSEVASVEGKKSAANGKEAMVSPSQGPLKTSTAGMSKITNYGESVAQQPVIIVKYAKYHDHPSMKHTYSTTDQIISACFRMGRLGTVRQTLHH